MSARQPISCTAQSLERMHTLDTVLFACVHNAGRSQMAAAWFNKLCDPHKAVAMSAGTQPGERVHHGVVDAMLEVGIDLSKTHVGKVSALG